MTVAGVAARKIVRGGDDRPAQANLDALMAMPAMSTGVRRREAGGRSGIKEGRASMTIMLALPCRRGTTSAAAVSDCLPLVFG
jgi:hypothetical protein